MTEHRRFADLNYGHPGPLTYIPRGDNENGPGILHTGRVATDAPALEIVGSSAELYPPSKRSIPEASSRLWQERQAQQRWLLTSQPEAFMGGATTFAGFLKEDMDRFESFDGSDAHGRLLAVGEMTDTTNMGNIHGQPLLAMAAGKSGEVLRLARIKDSQWQWDGDGSAVLNLSVIDTLIREDETMWPGDGLPITNIKFATAYWQHGSVRWLLVQRHTSVAILQPEYQLMALSRNDANSKWASHPPSYIAPNHLITLHHHQTGGNALSDVCFNAPSQGSSPQIVVIDECGYWSVWDLQGTRQVGKMTLRLVLYKCGHILEGIPDQVTPGSYFPAQKHGILQIGQPDQHEPRYVTSKRAESIKRTLGRSQHVLVWNPECVSLIDLEADSVLPKIDILSQTATKPDWILDIQRSPVDDGLVFVLTARQVIWLDLFPPGIEPGTTSRPRILFTCSHIGLGNENAKMSLCRASEEESDGTMVLIHSPSSDQLAAYWFSFAPDSQLPQWHRHITSLPGDGNNPLPNKVSSIRVQHAKVDVSIGKGESGPWTRYSRAKTKFYQVTILSEDLGVRYCIYASSTDPSLELGLPTSRVGWSKSEDRRRWRLRRRHFVRHMGETFVLPDSIPDEHWDSLIKEQRRRNDEEEISDGDDDDDDDDDNSSEVATAKVRPVFMKFGSIAQTIVSHLQAVVAEGENGLPTQLVDAVRSAIENGVAENSLPLTSWLEVVEALHQPAITFQDASEGMEAGIESLLDMTGENIIITQLRRQHAGEPLDSLVGFPFLREKFSDLWLAPVAESLSNEMQKARQIWIAELARDVFLSSYGVLVQNTRLFGKSSSEPDDESQFDDVFPSQSSQLPSSSQRIASSAAAARSSSAKDEADAAFRRLRLLAPSIEKGTLGSLKQPKILSYWPTERGVDTEDYVSSIAVATEERFSHAKRRLQKIEAKRKAQSEKFKRPDFMRQRLPPSDVLGKDHSSLGMDMGPRPVQAMSSQQRVPDSSQAAGLSGPSVIMSQPVPGAFGDRKTAKKGKRKSGFR